MSPSKMRKTRHYQDGQMAFHMGDSRDPEELSGEARDCYLLGWDEAAADAEANKPTDVEAALMFTADDVRARRERTGASMSRCKAELEKEALERAVLLVEDMEDVKVILRHLVDRIHVPAV